MFNTASDSSQPSLLLPSGKYHNNHDRPFSSIASMTAPRCGSIETSDTPNRHRETCSPLNAVGNSCLQRAARRWKRTALEDESKTLRSKPNGEIGMTGLWSKAPPCQKSMCATWHSLPYGHFGRTRPCAMAG
eukprot:Mycagemm_TRINITY_DN7718_c0_g1::TRINITY_DN7718_c0_g1_i1::g.3573::m.3573 type:complete len:132 gc:universal TRINITY_DN7718_c0_g1_i1:416-21(-)